MPTAFLESKIEALKKRKVDPDLLELLEDIAHELEEAKRWKED